MTTPYWFPAVTLVAGLVGGMLSEALRDKRQRERERKAQEDERATRAAEARAAFQRETLLALQEAVLKLVRNASAIHHQTEMRWREAQTWGRDPVSEPLNEESGDLARTVTTLRVRVIDDEIRNAVVRVQSAAAAATMGAMREELDDQARERATKARDDAGIEIEKLNQLIGAALRDLY